MGKCYVDMRLLIQGFGSRQYYKRKKAKTIVLERFETSLKLNNILLK